MIKSRVFTEEQIQFILDNYKGLGNKELLELVNERFGTDFTHNQVKGFKQRHRLDSGLRSYFKKGRRSHNKGLKQTDYMSAEAIERSKATRFKKGQSPHNIKPLGHERVTADGYVEVKVRETGNKSNFELKHRHIWEEHHGEKLKQTDVVVFLDQNRCNFEISNLRRMRQGDLSRINRLSLMSSDANINATAINWSELMQKINEKENANAHRTNQQRAAD